MRHGLLRALAGSCLSCLLVSAPASAASEWSRFVDGLQLDVTPGTWSGDFEFPGVYCLTFPEADSIHHRTSGLLRGTAVSLVMVRYQGDITAYVASSTMPASLHNDEEYRRQRASLFDHAARLPWHFTAEEMTSPLGPALRKQLTNVAQFTRDGTPFPLELQLYDPEAGILSLAETHLVSRKPDRIETAVFANVPAGATSERIEQLRAEVAGLAERLSLSLHTCTARQPPRISSDG